MTHFRSRALGLTLANKRVILLDLKADRYFGLADGPEAEVRTKVEAARLAAVGDRRSFSIGPHNFVPVEEVRPVTSLLDRPLPPARPGRVALAIAARISAGWQLRRQSMHQVMSDLAVSKAGIVAADTEWCDARAVLPIVAAFEASGRFLSDHDRCLSVSLALARTLIRRGLAVDLVIGVSGAPFAAHAWVQYGSTLLADQIDRVRRFSPVMKI